MQQSFQHIMTFSCQHQYFKDGLFKAINYSCPESTSKRLKDLGIVIKYFSGGFHLLSSNPELLATEILSNPLQFYLSCEDPYYINYSDLPNFSATKDLLYFNNLGVPYNEEQKVFRLHTDDFIREKDLVKLSHGVLEIPLFKEGNTYSFKDASNEEISSEHILRNPNEPDTVMLNDMPQGLIRILLDDKVVNRVYQYPNPVWKKPLGTVEIFLGVLHDQFKTYGKVNYSINFKNRETIWNYYFTDPGYLKFEDLKIINKEKKIVFNPPEKKELQRNSVTLLFQSKEKIPLLEYSEDNFQLVEKFDEELKYGKVVIKNLTRASPDMLYQGNHETGDPLGTKTLYSHIYL